MFLHMIDVGIPYRYLNMFIAPTKYKWVIGLRIVVV